MVVAQQFLPSGVWGYDPGLTDYSYDPALAKSLLTQAGFPNGFDTTLTYGTLSRLYLPDPTGTASAINGDLEAVGIHAQVVSMDWSSYLGAVAAGVSTFFCWGGVSTTRTLLASSHLYSVVLEQARSARLMTCCATRWGLSWPTLV